MERSTIFNGKIHYKWPFSIAIYVSLPEGTMFYPSQHCAHEFFARASPSARDSAPSAAQGARGIANKGVGFCENPKNMWFLLFFV